MNWARGGGEGGDTAPPIVPGQTIQFSMNIPILLHPQAAMEEAAKKSPFYSFQ